MEITVNPMRTATLVISGPGHPQPSQPLGTYRNSPLRLNSNSHITKDIKYGMASCNHACIGLHVSVGSGAEWLSDGP